VTNVVSGDRRNKGHRSHVPFPDVVHGRRGFVLDIGS
jgi:hypothetical protein